MNEPVTKVKTLKDLPIITGQKVYTVYTDGGCAPNPGTGGWAAVILTNQNGKLVSQVHLTGNRNDSTNNQMELLGPIMALESIGEPSTINIVTDSKYVKDGITSWIKRWKQNNWVTASKTAVKNKELWQRLDRENNRHNVTWDWVKGHSGNDYNELADRLCTEAASRLRMEGATPQILNRDKVL